MKQRFNQRVTRQREAKRASTLHTIAARRADGEESGQRCYEATGGRRTAPDHGHQDIAAPGATGADTATKGSLFQTGTYMAAS